MCQLNQDQIDPSHTREYKDLDDGDEEDAWDLAIQTSNAFDIFQDFDDDQFL